MTLPQPLAIKPPSFALALTLPLQTFDAYILAYALGYTLNFRFAAALPFGQSLAIIFYPFSFSFSF